MIYANQYQKLGHPWSNIEQFIEVSFARRGLHSALATTHLMNATRAEALSLGL